MAKELPVGVAQKKVLDVLGKDAATWGHAEEIFELLGIRVRAVRVGRSSEPRVRLRYPAGGAFTAEGDGESWGERHSLSTAQIEALKPWWEQ